MHEVTEFPDSLALQSRTVRGVAQIVRVDPDRLTYQRELQAMTQQQLATAAGVGRITISNLERGLTQPRMPTLRKIAKALRVKPAELLAHGAA